MKSLSQQLQSTNNQYRCLVIGDAMVDSYMNSAPAGISDEAPVMVLDWIKTERTFGGMLNVAKSIAALGINTHAIGIVNQTDDAGRFILDRCENLGIHQHWIFDDTRPPIEKARVRTDPEAPPIQQIARIDFESTEPLANDTRSELNKTLDDLLATKPDVVAASDYLKGTIDETLARRLVEECNAKSIPLLVDAKPESLAWFTGCSLITPNECEARAFVATLSKNKKHHSDASSLDHSSLARLLADALNANILLTCAENGMYLAESKVKKEGDVQHFAAPETINLRTTSGAGDVLLAVHALAAASRAPFPDATEWSREALAIALQRDGTCSIEPDDFTPL